MYLIYDVGGTFIKYAWLTEKGEILEKGKIPTPTKEDQGVTEFVEVLGKIYDEYKDRENFQGIAISLPGQIDIENGIVYGGGGLRYMDRVHLKELLSKRCNFDKIAMENDGKCAALAEVWKGNAKDVQDACVLVIGTGIGGGIIHNKRVIHGKRMQAGEVSFAIDEMKRSDLDKICCVEDMDVYEVIEALPFTWGATSATAALSFWFSKKKGIPVEEATGEKIYEMAEAGDETAKEMLEDFYFNIAKKCCNLYVTFDPEVILIGGGISANPNFIEGIRRYVERLKGISHIYREIKIDICRFHNDSNLLGALYNFMQLYNVEIK